MKKLLLTLALAFTLLTGCDFFVDPVAYNDKIVEIDTKALDAYEAYDAVFSSTPIEGDLEALDKKRAETIETIKPLKEELAAMEGLRDDTSLRDAFVEDLDNMIAILENEEKALIELYKEMAAAEETSDEQLDRENELIDTINQKNDAMYEKVSGVQEAFAEEHGYDILPSYQP